jgi:class 3 adenylate cyclase
MATSGLLVETDKHAAQLVAFGRAIVSAATAVLTPLGDPVRIRVGIHSGRVMSGIVGTLRSRYCLFGGKGGRAT